MLKRKITAYHTHIEVYPYERGENKSIEDFYSVYDQVYHKMTPIAYCVYEDTLYLPRGTSVAMLEKQFNSPVIVSCESDPVKSIRIQPQLEPNSKTQEEAVDFLCSRNQFIRGESFSQLSLNIGTGKGKTIATILALSEKYRCKTVIIVHQSILKDQWKNEILKASDLDESRIANIVGSKAMEACINHEIDADIYLVNHQTIHMFGDQYGWEQVHEFFKSIGVGLKIYDEAHKYFSNIMMIDFFSNTKKTFYLTATFKRNQYENRMFNRAFSNTYRFGEETKNYEENRKHVVYYRVNYNSYPDNMTVSRLYNKFSVSSYKFIDYALYQDENHTLLKVLDFIMEKVKNLNGKILVITPKIDSTEFIANFMIQNYGKTVGVINSNKSEKENEEAKLADVISSTIKSLGTAVDIKGLRVIINFEPFSSDVNTEQFIGRLREYSKTDDTFMFDCIDNGLSSLVSMADKRRRVVSKIAKEIRIINL